MANKKEYTQADLKGRGWNEHLIATNQIQKGHKGKNKKKKRGKQ